MLKKIKTIILALSVFVFIQCHVVKPYYTSLVSNIPMENSTNALIELKSYGKGQKEKDAIIDAEKNAFNSLFFLGVPNSPQNTPLVVNEVSSKKANPLFFEIFFNNLDYRRFITKISTNSEGKYSDGRKVMSANLKINIAALRSYLETNNIIKKFGY